ncbi:MAG: hypothetical protein KDA22_10800 [Phycisphaerales bacterium]|nr:hypothetical protein [Phycisphaerales bacterium]
MTDQTAHAPACPRCGYDVRGEVATWTDRCPLDGRCNECGLDFRWQHVLDPRIQAPRWYVEQRKGRPVPVQIVATAWFALVRPWWFWRQVRLEHRVDLRRLGPYAFVLLIGFGYAAIGIAAACSFTALKVMYSGNFYTTYYGYGPSDGWETLISALFVAAAPFLTRSLPQAASGPTGPLGPMGGSAPWDFAATYLPQVGTIAILAAVFAVSSSLTFLALPVTRRRCKVRMVHVVRVATIGLACWLPALLAPVLDPAAHLLKEFGLLLPVRIDGVLRLVPILLPVLLVIWWWSATRSYLRMPHAWAVALSVAAVGILCTLSIAAYAIAPLLR